MSLTFVDISRSSLAAVVWFTAAATAADVNLLRNPGFEEGGYPPVFWLRPPSGGYQFAVDEKIRHAGKHSLRMAGLVDDAWRHWAQSDIPVRPGETYTFGAWVKTEKVAVGKDGLGALVEAIAHDDADRVLGTAKTA
ncbi:MAG: hypothetical protein FJ279_22385, partial [Planctomycetes bacterium]|nr:hypothetical protein [Planctomycetota bacterium]